MNASAMSSTKLEVVNELRDAVCGMTVAVLFDSQEDLLNLLTALL